MQTGSTTAAATLAASPAPTPNGFADITGEDFFKVLLAQLQSQDPLEPMKSNEMMAQISQIRQIEVSTKLTHTLDQLARQGRIDRAASLIGKLVQGGNKEQVGIAGIVTGVRLEGQKVVLELDNGQSLALEDVTYVTTSDNPDADPAVAAGQSI